MAPTTSHSLLTRDTRTAYHIVGLGSTIFTGRVVAAVGISGPIWRLSEHLGGRPGSREDTLAPHDGITPPGRRARPSDNGGRT